MQSRKMIFQQTGIVAAGQVVCVGIMLGIFALLGQFSQSVLLGGIFGGLIAIANFFFMALGAALAADMAQRQDVKGGKATVQISYIVRMVLLFVVLFALVKSGVCHVVTAVVPLVFNRPILTLAEFFRKKGGMAQ